MRVLVLAGSYPSDEHPARGAFVREQARAVAAGHDVVVACHDGAALRLPRSYTIVEERRDGLRTLRIRHRASPLALLPGLNALHLRRALGSVLDDVRPDIVHAHFFYVAVWALGAARRRGIPLVLSEHSSAFPRGRVQGRLRRQAEAALHGAALVCPVSEHLREAIRGAGFDVPMRVVPNPIDAAAFGPPRATAGEPVVVAVATLTALKGIELLIDAMAGVEARLVVVGDGAHRAALEARAAGRGVAGRVEFAGELPKERVARALAAADLFCLPSHGETHGVAFIEALASGLPVLGTRVGGVPEIVGPDDGELVAPGDGEALAAALRRMLDSLERYDREAIRARAAARFGYPHVAALWDEVYSAATADQQLGRGRAAHAIDERGLERVESAPERAAQPRAPGHGRDQA